MTFRVTNREFNAELKDRTSAKFRSLSAELEQEVLTQNNRFMKCSPKIKKLEFESRVVFVCCCFLSVCLFFVFYSFFFAN